MVVRTTSKLIFSGGAGGAGGGGGGGGGGIRRLRFALVVVGIAKQE